jgi:nucleoside-diphosphate-sugar epimerase
MKENKVLVVGGVGYCGGFLVDLLRLKGMDVIVYDNLLYEERYLKDCDFVFGDVRETEKILSLVKERRIDTVVWLAAIVGDGACNVDQTLTQEINFLSFKRFVDGCEKSIQIIFPSSCSVYGMNKEILNEQSEVNPLSLYAATKYEAEKYLRENHENSLVFRLGTLFGVGDAFSRLRFDLVANILTLRASFGKELTVFGGDQWRPLLHVKDVARAIYFGIVRNQKGLYNLSWKNYRICDVATEIVETVGRGSINLVEIQFEDLRDYRVDSREYTIDSGFEPIYGLTLGIQEIFNLVEQNRIKNPFDRIYNNEKFMKEIHG